MNWDKPTEEKFHLMIGKIPVFLRDIAQKKVSQKAQDLVQKENRTAITEKDMVDAFFAETPFGFHGPLKNDMREFGIDYVQYGYEK